MTADQLNELEQLLEDLRPRRVINHLSLSEIDQLEARRARMVNEIRYAWSRAVVREAESA